MERPTKVHCFFEQSGTFKREFIKIGIPAEDYDIQNHFGETDHVIDLFAEIEAAYDGRASVFDGIGGGDLIMAFFPCIEFSCVAQMWYSLGQADYKRWPYRKRIDYMVGKNRARAKMFELLMMFCGVCLERRLQMIFENPWNEQSYLKQNVFLKRPSLIDADRTRRGDFRIKPTAYWFFNREPCRGVTSQLPKTPVRTHNQLRRSPRAGICSEERSMISPDYARNFIADFILGVPLTADAFQQGELPLGLEAVT